MESKILRELPSLMCLYCGKKQQLHYDDNQEYWECDCKDAKKEREIQKKIRKLELELPKKRFTIVIENVLYELNEYGEW